MKTLIELGTTRRGKNPDEARKILSSQANLTIRDADDHVKLTGKDIVQGSAKQEFKQGTNEPAVTFKLKDRAKFKKLQKKFLKTRKYDGSVVRL